MRHTEMSKVEPVDGVGLHRPTTWLPMVLFLIVGIPIQAKYGSDVSLFIRLVPGLLLLLSFLYFTRFVVSKPALIATISLCAYFVLINTFARGYTNYTYITLISIVIGLMIASCAALNDRSSKLLTFLLTYYLYLNLVGLAIVAGWFVATGHIFDLHKFIFPFSEARQFHYLGFQRLSGLHFEPGNYSTAVYSVVLMRSLLIGRISTRLHIVAIFSSIFTFAMTGILIAGVFCIAVFVELYSNNKNWRFGMIVTAIVVIIFLFLLLSDTRIADYIITRTTIGQPGSGSMEHRFFLFANFWDTISNGHGLFIGAPMGESYCGEFACAHKQALGSFIVLSYNFGVIPSLAVLLWVLIRLWNQQGPAIIILIVPFIFGRMAMFDPFTWLVIGVLLFPQQRTQFKSGK